MNIPKARSISKEKVIRLLREEILRKDKEIEKLRRENELLFKVSLKNAKRELESKGSR